MTESNEPKFISIGLVNNDTPIVALRKEYPKFNIVTVRKGNQLLLKSIEPIKSKPINIVSVSVSDLLYEINSINDIEDKIIITLYNKKYFVDENFDDTDISYCFDLEKFYQEFEKTNNDINEYFAINFKTENDCKKFLESIGLFCIH